MSSIDFYYFDFRIGELYENLSKIINEKIGNYKYDLIGDELYYKLIIKGIGTHGIEK